MSIFNENTCKGLMLLGPADDKADDARDGRVGADAHAEHTAYGK
jgi:hypothetical protein